MLQETNTAASPEGQEGDTAAAVFYQTAQTLEADDDYSEFGTALALSSSTNALVVGIPRDSEGPTVQVYKTQQMAINNNDQDDGTTNYQWQTVEVFSGDSSRQGYWVAISNDASRFVYSAPNYQPDPGKADYAYMTTETTSAATYLWHQKNVNNHIELEVELRDGECTSFGETVALASSNSPVVVITRAGCYNNKEKQRTITIWEGYDRNGHAITTDLLVPNGPTSSANSCTMGQTGTAATVSKDGNRIVVLASCLDQKTYQDRTAIYTFEKDTASRTWVERVASTRLIVDTELLQYRMSSFAFDADAKTVVLTTAGIGTDLACYKWNVATVSWQESWRKVGTKATGIANRVALSGNGKRLAFMGYYTVGTNMIPQLDVYNLP
jgi:hypothetical protein